MMKKRIGYMIAALIVALFAGLLLWRFLPRSCAHMMSVDESAFTNFSSHAMIHRFDLGSTYTDMYYIEHIPRQEAAYGEIMEILASSRYRPDFRNLLPWDLSSLSSGKHYDGRTVTFVFSAADRDEESIYIQFLSRSILSIHIGNKSGFRIYHPTNRETFDKVVEFLQANGVKQ